MFTVEECEKRWQIIPLKKLIYHDNDPSFNLACTFKYWVLQVRFGFTKTVLSVSTMMFEEQYLSHCSSPVNEIACHVLIDSECLLRSVYSRCSLSSVSCITFFFDLYWTLWVCHPDTLRICLIFIPCTSVKLYDFNKTWTCVFTQSGIFIWITKEAHKQQIYG